MSIVYTDRDKCKRCYACIRDCPAKAIKVQAGLAQVIKERCITCGNCLRVCATGAKRVESDTGIVWQMLGRQADTIAIPSSSFPAALPGLHPGQLVAALKKMGFSEVIEDAFGAELIGREYVRLLDEAAGKPVLSANCPAVVAYIERYYPGLIGNLAPVVSPTIAMGRLIKWRYRPQAKVVFIGPCVSKKAEAKDPKVEGAVDAVLTFAELKEMFIARGITPENLAPEKFSGPTPNLGRLYAVAGGLLKVAGLSDDILRHDIISAHGRDYVIKILDEFARGEIDARFLDLYFCHGCLDGPVIDNELSSFRRKELIAEYAAANEAAAKTELDLREYTGMALRRSFTPQATALATPDEKDIESALSRIGKASHEEQVNCGACGYKSCRELAIAVCQELAEVEMCWPYVVHELKSTQEDLIQAEKLTSLGQLAASIAHEINNPLSGVLIYFDLLTKKIGDGSMSKAVTLDHLDKMNSEVSRVAKLVQDLLDFARQTPPSLRRVNVNEVISRAFDLAAHSAQLHNIEVAKQLDASLPQPVADFDQLEQVCTNLILNAIQAMPNGGSLTLRTLASNSHVKIEVQDTGCGIAPQNLRKLFTPFFTTKREVKGVGLGLAVSHGIIQRHHGRIEVQSKEGEGSTFTVYLPINND